MSDECELRLFCLQEACRQHGEHPDDAVNAARKYADFVLGTKDAKTVEAARKLARVVDEV